MRERIEIGYHAVVAGDGETFGAVRGISPEGLVVYVENAGDFRVPLEAIEAVHSQKVVLRRTALDQRMLEAITHAHDAEESVV